MYENKNTGRNVRSVIGTVLILLGWVGVWLYIGLLTGYNLGWDPGLVVMICFMGALISGVLIYIPARKAYRLIMDIINKMDYLK